MITHTIAPYKAPKLTYQQQTRRYRGESGSDQHKLFIFERTLKNCKFKRGEHVLYKRNKYQIIEIDKELDEHVVWDGLTACIVTLWDGRDEADSMIAVHPNQLKRDR